MQPARRRLTMAIALVAVCTLPAVWLGARAPRPLMESGIEGGGSEDAPPLLRGHGSRHDVGAQRGPTSVATPTDAGGRVLGSLVPPNPVSPAWRCGYSIQRPYGLPLRAGWVGPGPFAIDWPWEAGCAVVFATAGSRTFRAVLTAPTTDVGPIRLMASILYRGRLSTRDGTAVADAVVELLGRARTRVGRSATTRADGGFTLDTDLRELPIPSPDGTSYPDLSLSVTRSGSTEGCEILASPMGFFASHDVTVEFERGKTLFVRRPGGLPVAGAEVALDPDPDGRTPESSLATASRGMTDADGKCSLRWPRSLRRAIVRVRAPRGPVASGFLQASDVVSKDSITLTLPEEGGSIEVVLRKDPEAPLGERDEFQIQARWAASLNDGVETMVLRAPMPQHAERWSVRILDTPSLAFAALQPNARWRARYTSADGHPVVSDGTVEFRRVGTILEGEVALSASSSSAEPEDLLWLALRDDVRSGVGEVEGVALAANHDGRTAGGWLGRILWETTAPDRGGRLLAVEGIPSPRGAGLDATRVDSVALAIRTSGGGQRSATSTLSEWAAAYESSTPMPLRLAPCGPAVHVVVRSADGQLLSGTQILAMTASAAAAAEEWTQEEYLTDVTGGTDVIPPCADKGIVVVARSADGRIGTARIPAGTSTSDLVLRDGQSLVTTIRLFDGRVPTTADAYLVTRPATKWTVPCAWDESHLRFSSVIPIDLDAFDLRVEASAVEVTGSAPQDRKEHRYRLALRARDAQGKLLELPPLGPHSFDVR